MASVQTRSQQRSGDYGIDGATAAMAGLAAMGIIGIGLMGLALIHVRSGRALLALLESLGGLVLLQVIPSFLYSTRRGKLQVWDNLLAGLQLRGDEHVLDMGCGRGAVLASVARIIPRGHAVGLDLWKAKDQSGNSPEATSQNLELEGVRGRCDLKTGDMRAVPFPDGTFDLVVSSLAIHNIKSRRERDKAIEEAARVLKVGGRLMIADLMWTKSYAERLGKLGMENVVERRLDWRFWFGALGLATGLVTASKPTAAR
jgi:arsenite methyltransferase